MNEPAPALLTISETAQQLRVSTSYIKKLIREDRLSSVKLGRCRRIEPEAIDKFLQQSRRQSIRRMN